MTPRSLMLIVLTSYICLVNAQSDCPTPNGGNGTCKSIYACPSVLKVVRKRGKTQEDYGFLKKSECGFQGTVPDMCCADPCYTPDGQPGKCINIYSCTHIYQKLSKPPLPREVMQFIQNSVCVGEDNRSVCCGPPRDSDVVVSSGNCGATVIAFPPDPRTECCGVDVSFETSITGGPETAIDQYPWLVMIEYTKLGEIKLLCGGALISGRYVLTAAHCVTADVLHLGTPKNVRLGEYDTYTDGIDCTPVVNDGEDCTQGAMIIPIETIIAHPEYRSSWKHSPNDIALIRLVKNAPFTDFIRPICLPNEDVTETPFENFFAAGWSNVSTRPRSRDVKIHVTLVDAGKHACELVYKSSNENIKLTGGQICVDAYGGGNIDIFKGNPGGPLMYQNGRNYEVIGVASFGLNLNNLSNVPVIYTKVYKHNAWIRNNIVP